MNKPLEILVEFTQDLYDRRTPEDQQRIILDCAFYTHELQTDPDVVKRNSYQQHVVECVPCMQSTVIQARKRLAPENEVNRYIAKLEMMR